MDVADLIHAANTRFTEAVHAKDAASMPALYTQDGQIVPPNHDLVRGAEAIVAFWQDAFVLGLSDARPVTHEIIPMGDLAVEVGEYTVFGENDVRLDSGKIIVI